MSCSIDFKRCARQDGRARTVPLKASWMNVSAPLLQRKKFYTLLICLHSINDIDKFNSDVCFKAKCLLESWCKFQNIAMEFIFQDLFNSATPVLKCLQTSGVDYLSAANKVNTLQQQLSIKRENQFGIIYDRQRSLWNIYNKAL